MTWNKVVLGDCLEVLRGHTDASVDAVVTDPPYGLGTREPTPAELVAFLQGSSELNTGGDFMGRNWSVPSVAVWKECLRVLKPGGHLLSFGGTRTFDLISLGLRAAGFEYRDTLQWLYGQGFPKSLDIGKAIDKAKGLKREVVGSKLGRPGYSLSDGKTGTSLSGSADGSLRSGAKECELTAAASEEAERWEGWGTALKPSWEPILMFRAPLCGTVAENVLTHGTGGLNVQACRVGGERGHTHSRSVNHDGINHAEREGRWPPNVILQHADCERRADGSWECSERCPIEQLALQGGIRRTGVLDGERHRRTSAKGWSGPFADDGEGPAARGRFGGDEGHVTRYFTQLDAPGFLYSSKVTAEEATMGGRVENVHPTRKPVTLMRWLVRLVCPPGGIVLDPYCGSGSTLVAAMEEGMEYLGIDRDQDAVATSHARVTARRQQGVQTSLLWFVQGGK